MKMKHVIVSTFFILLIVGIAYREEMVFPSMQDITGGYESKIRIGNNSANAAIIVNETDACEKRIRNVTTNTSTSIIITSSLIPTHPSVKMINETYHSLSFLNGLSLAETPIFITVDGLPKKMQSDENLQRYQEYVRNLRLLFKDHPHVTILTSFTNGHLSGSLNMAVELVTTKFIYIVQHDFKFIRTIDHTALVNAMNAYPDILRIVRFDKRVNMRLTRGYRKFGPECDTNLTTASGLQFINGIWSDNNHITTTTYYRNLLKDIGPTPRPPESPMMHAQARVNCTYHGQMVYGPVGDPPYIQHLDGRLSQTYRRWRE